MVDYIKQITKNFFSKGHERTLLAKKNIVVSFFLKGISICIGLILVPMTINYLNPSNYGVWLTLSSVINWFSFFDIGLGNGLKNKLAESNALNNYTNSKTYISTTYGALSIISTLLFLFFLIINLFVNWNKVLNVPQLQDSSLNKIALIVFGFFCIQFIVQIINSILIAFHEISKVSLISVIGQCISLVIIYVLTKETSGSLLYIVLVLSGIPVLITLLANIWYFKNKYKLIAPSFKLMNFKYAKSLLSVGGVFFFIQLGGLVLLQTDNIVITQLFGPQKVTIFNLSYKLFSVISMTFAIIMSPFWTAFTDAYSKGDFEWIRAIFSKMYKYCFVLTILTFILLFISPYLYHLWVGDVIKIPFELSFAMALYTIGFCWLLIHCSLLNGISKIRIQLYLYIFSTVINIPLAIILGKFFGLPGITYSNIIVFVIMGAILYIQCQKIIHQNAKGIWDQ